MNINILAVVTGRFTEGWQKKNLTLWVLRFFQGYKWGFLSSGM